MGPSEEKEGLKQITDEGVSREQRGQMQSTYALYQLRYGSETQGLYFRSYDELRTQGQKVRPELYKQVYTATLEDGMGLEDLFEKFNINHPADYKGHSLSVSDVIVLCEQGETSAHYVDSVGFVPLSKNFVSDQNRGETTLKRQFQEFLQTKTPSEKEALIDGVELARDYGLGYEVSMLDNELYEYLTSHRQEECTRQGESSTQEAEAEEIAPDAMLPVM